MRTIGIILFFSLLTSYVFGQQYLWSTIDQDNIAQEYVPIEDVPNEVLKFYDHYEMHYDFSGFSKNRFIEEADFGFEDLKWINDINELTVFAARSNMGTGSIVLVMFISDKNMNLIIFSNSIVGGDFHYISNEEYDRKKFKLWLKTLMN
jgi:hypothetical protein